MASVWFERELDAFYPSLSPRQKAFYGYAIESGRTRLVTRIEPGRKDLFGLGPLFGFGIVVVDHRKSGDAQTRRPHRNQRHGFLGFTRFYRLIDDFVDCAFFVEGPIGNATGFGLQRNWGGVGAERLVICGPVFLD